MPPTAEQEKSAAPKNDPTLMGVLAYLGPLVIVPYLMAKDDSFVRFHTKQGLVLFGIELIVYLAMGMLMSGLFFLLPVVTIINFGCLILSIIGIVNVIQKKEVALPLVGSLTKHLPF